MILHQIEIRFPSNARYMQVVREVVSFVSGLFGLPQKEIRLVTLACDEACANIIRHTYRNEPDHPIHLHCEIIEDAIHFRFFDWGDCVNPDSIKHRNLDELRPGGLGTYFMKNILDHIEYKKRPEGGNEIILIKKRRCSDSTEASQDGDPSPEDQSS